MSSGAIERELFRLRLASDDRGVAVAQSSNELAREATASMICLSTVLLRKIPMVR
jgi:hypothetical protein